MKYVSIDIETTGLDPDDDLILEIAAIVDDTLAPEVPIISLPRFVSAFKYDRLCGSPVALSMNERLLRGMRGLPDNCRPEFVHKQFDDFLAANFPGEKITCAGKNFASFDRQFIKTWDDRYDHINFPPRGESVSLINRLHHRSIDPAMFYIHADDFEVPATMACLARAGCTHIAPMHKATEDAAIAIYLIREGLKRLTH